MSGSASDGGNYAGFSSPILIRKKRDEDTDIQRAKKIRQARSARGLTQAQLAQMVGVRREAIEEYESGQPVPNQETITKLERALGVRL